MPAQPVIGDTSWGATQNAFTGTSLDSATGKIKNEALQVADTAPIADAALANKKYVDSGGSPSVDDSESNTMVKSHSYLAQTTGMVNSYLVNAAGAGFSGFVGAASDPTVTGLKLAQVESAGAGEDDSICFPVAKGNYFEITATGGTPVIIWTPLTGDSSLPVDQD